MSHRFAAWTMSMLLGVCGTFALMPQPAHASGSGDGCDPNRPSSAGTGSSWFNGWGNADSGGSVEGVYADIMNYDPWVSPTYSADMSSAWTMLVNSNDTKYAQVGWWEFPGGDSVRYTFEQVYTGSGVPQGHNEGGSLQYETVNDSTYYTTYYNGGSNANFSFQIYTPATGHAYTSSWTYPAWGVPSGSEIFSEVNNLASQSAGDSAFPETLADSSYWTPTGGWQEYYPNAPDGGTWPSPAQPGEVYWSGTEQGVAYQGGTYTGWDAACPQTAVATTTQASGSGDYATFQWGIDGLNTQEGEQLQGPPDVVNINGVMYFFGCDGSGNLVEKALGGSWISSVSGALPEPCKDSPGVIWPGGSSLVVAYTGQNNGIYYTYNWVNVNGGWPGYNFWRQNTSDVSYYGPSMAYYKSNFYIFWRNNSGGIEATIYNNPNPESIPATGTGRPNLSFNANYLVLATENISNGQPQYYYWNGGSWSGAIGLTTLQAGSPGVGVGVVAEPNNRVALYAEGDNRIVYAGTTSGMGQGIDNNGWVSANLPYTIAPYIDGVTAAQYSNNSGTP